MRQRFKTAALSDPEAAVHWCCIRRRRRARRARGVCVTNGVLAERPAAWAGWAAPRLHAAALNTTAAAVRVNALVALDKVAPGLGPPEWDATLAVLRQLSTVGLYNTSLIIDQF